MSADFGQGANWWYERAGLPFTSLANFTIAFWIMVDTTNLAGRRAFRFGNGANSISLGFQNDGTTLQWVDEGIAWRGSGSALGTGAWKHVLVTRAASGNVFLYVNGTNVENFAVSPNAFNSAHSLWFGGPGDAANSVDAKLAELAIWDAALPLAARAALAKGICPLNFSRGNLRRYVPLFGALASEPDLAVGGTWTKTGSASAGPHPPVGRIVPFAG